jgi:CspA family cold shock protein
MLIGVVKSFNAERGFGFIIPDDGGKDVFVQVTDVRAAGYDTLKPGQRISFELAPNKPGKPPRAVGLRLFN